MSTASDDRVHAQVRHHLTKLDGEFKGLRAQFTEFAKRCPPELFFRGTNYKLSHERGAPTPSESPPLEDLLREMGELRAQVQMTSALRQEQAELRRALDAQSNEINGLQRSFNAMRSQFQRSSEGMLSQSQRSTDGMQSQVQRDVAGLVDRVREQDQLIRRLQNQKPSVNPAEATTQGLALELQDFKKQIYDSGVLAP
ncbi:unnamed protein product, partial [Polarella glacialis]